MTLSISYKITRRTEPSQNHQTRLKQHFGPGDGLAVMAMTVVTTRRPERSDMFVRVMVITHHSALHWALGLDE